LLQSWNKQAEIGTGVRFAATKAEESLP